MKLFSQKTTTLTRFKSLEITALIIPSFRRIATEGLNNVYIYKNFNFEVPVK